MKWTKSVKETAFVAGGSAAMYQGRFPVYRNYNAGTNLTPGYEVFGVFDTQEEADQVAFNAETSREEAKKRAWDAR